MMYCGATTFNSLCNSGVSRCISSGDGDSSSRQSRTTFEQNILALSMPALFSKYRSTSWPDGPHSTRPILASALPGLSAISAYWHGTGPVECTILAIVYSLLYVTGDPFANTVDLSP